MARESRFRNAIVAAAVVASALVPAASRTMFAQATPGAAAVVAGAPAGQEVRFADQIKSMLDEDRSAPPPQNAILFIGSSIFRQWTNVKEHMAPLPVFNRAFGGSRTWEVLHYMDRIVLPYRPRIIVYYTGSNDVNAGQPAQAIVGRTMEFMMRAHTALPATRIYYVAINRSPDKRDKWDVVDAVNAQMKTTASINALPGLHRSQPCAVQARRTPHGALSAGWPALPSARVRRVHRHHQASAHPGVARGGEIGARASA